MSEEDYDEELKIACIYNTSLTDWRGGPAGLNNMLHIFKQLGIETTDVISYSFHSNKFGIEHTKINSSLNTIIIHLPYYLPDLLKAFSIFLAFIYAWKPTKRCDIIFANAGILSAVPAVIFGRIFGKPVISHYIDADTHPVPEAVYKYIGKNTYIVFAISPYLIDKAKRYGCKNIIYLPAFVDTNLFSVSMNDRKNVRENIGIENDDIVIGYAGGFWYVEGIPNLLQAFRDLLKRYSNIKMIILGGIKAKNDDDIPKLVKDLDIEDSVTIVPPQPHEEVPKFLSACDITCCPKIDCEINRAANPIKVVEYLSMGVPTVCSAVGGITYTIEDRVDGILVKPGDVKDLEEKLEWVILNPERAKEIGENGRKTAIERYSFDAIENTIKRAIEEIMNGKKEN